MILAHGLNGSTDLPIPYTYALIGAAWALTASFAILIFAWRTPRLDPNAPGRVLPAWVQRTVDSPITRNVVSGFALLFTLWVCAAAFFGPDDGKNALPGVFYVLLWVGLVVASLLFGPVWRVLSPVRTLYRLICRALRRPLETGPREYRMWWGYWPAVAGLFAFVWLELVAPDPASLPAIRTWCLVYFFVTFVGTTVFGTRWCANADPFEVYSTLASRLSPFGRRGVGGPLVVRWPLDHLGSMPVQAGSVALVATLLGSTAFDSFSALPWWRNLLDAVARDHTFVSPTTTTVLLRSAALLGFVVFVAGTFWLAARATAGVTRSERAELPGLLSHSLIPIVIGYVFAHYLTYLVEKGQATLILLADPFGRGWNPFGIAHLQVNYLLSAHPTLVATIKVCAVLIGHVLGVTAAHDKSLAVLPRAHRLTGQLALLLTMVGYTFGGLYLLFGG